MYMALAMWATQPSSSCRLTEEPRRRLNLERQLDREHLQRDAWKIRDAARRFASGLSSSEPDDGAITKCGETLARQLAAAHDVTLEEVRAAMYDAP